MPTVMVTGAAGFIGRAVAEAAALQGSRVVAIVTPGGTSPRGADSVHAMRLPDPLFSDILLSSRPDLIVHCAGTSSVGVSFVSPTQDFSDNVVAAHGVLDAARRNSPASRVLLLSSAAVIGEPAERPTPETATMQPLSPYGFHKQMAETLCSEFAKVWGVRTAVARIFSVYGPGLRRQLLWDVYRKWLSGPVIELDGTGDETRDMVWIDDVVAALDAIASRAPFHGEIFHLGTGRATTVRSLARQLVTALGEEKPCTFSGRRRQGDPLFWQADNRRLNELGVSSWVQPEVGIGRYAAWAHSQAGLIAPGV